jgi:hypothetical protein
MRYVEKVQSFLTLTQISGMSNIKVKQAHGGDVTEFIITHEITDTLPESGVNLFFRQYVRRILYAARGEHGCFKFYVVCEGVFQVRDVRIYLTKSPFNHRVIQCIIQFMDIVIVV